MLFRSFIFSLLFVFSISFINAQEQVNIPGFGTLPVTKNGDQYQITLNNYGTFNFKGTLNPIDLETDIQVDQLKNFPGYEVMSNFGLTDIRLKVSSAGLFIGAKADAEKNLKVLFDFLNVKAPFVTINTKISKTSFALEGILDFTREPVIAKVIPPAGTELHVEKITMLAGAGKGGANISVITDAKMKPTKWDPALKTKFELAYNLRNQEISGSGSMIDTWADPFNLDKHLKKNSISFTNTAVSFGWVIGAPSPTTLGFAVENAKFFGLEFGTMMSISPANGQIALKASRKKMTMNDFTSVLRDGFGLNVPNVFPDNAYIRDAEILFSPNGGEIGEFEIEQGFAMKGKANLFGAVEAEIDYKANFESGFYLDFKMDADLKEALMKEIKKTNLPKAATEKVLSTFQLRKVHTRLEAGMDMQMSGKTQVKFEVFGKSHDFKLEASLDPQSIINSIIDKIKKETKIIQVAEDVVKIAGSAATASIKTVEKGWAEVSKRAGDVAEYRHHNPLINADHRSGDRCKSHCVPNRAKKMGNPVYEKSNAAVKDFYKKVIPKLAQIEGSHKRKELIWDDWKRLVNSINKNWKKVRDDKHYWGYDKDKKDVERYGRQYRSLIDAKKAKHEKYRLKIWEKLMKESIKPIPEAFNKLTSIYFLKNMANEEYYMDISGYHFTAKRKKKTPVSVYPKDGGKSGLQGIDRFIKFIPHPTEKGYFYIQPQHSDYVFDVKGDNKTPGNEIVLYPKGSKREVQLFKTIPVRGKKKTYYIQNKESGYYVTSNGKSKPLTQEKKTKAKNQQWYFEMAQATDMAPVKRDIAYALRNVEANRHLDLPGSRAHAKKKDAHIQLWNMDYHPDRYITIKKSPFDGIHHVHHMHSAHHYWDIEGGSKRNGAKLQLWDLNQSGAQRFRFIYAGSPMTFYIENPASGKFLDASASKINQNGCPVQIWTPDGSANQQWKLEPAGPKWFAPKRKKVKIKAAYSDKTWDLAGGPEKAKEKRSRVQIWSDENKVDRYYVIKRSGDHDWVWMEFDGGMRVDVEGGNVRKKGNKLHTWTRHNGDAQKFAIHPTGKYTCVIYTKGYKVLDVSGGKINDNGPDIHLWNKHLGAAQQFQLIDAETGKPIDFTKYID